MTKPSNQARIVPRPPSRGCPDGPARPLPPRVAAGTVSPLEPRATPGDPAREGRRTGMSAINGAGGPRSISGGFGAVPGAGGDAAAAAKLRAIIDDPRSGAIGEAGLRNEGTAGARAAADQL